MKKVILITLIATTITSHAQVYIDRIGFDLESIAHIDIGWIKTVEYTKAPVAKQLGHRSYSAKQIGYSQQFVTWMQQSYLPKGCLGDVSYYQNEIPKHSSTNSSYGNIINKNLDALPHLYGAMAKMYMFLKKDGNGKFVPQNNLGDYWHIEANQLQYISNPVPFISTPEQYYFAMPRYQNDKREIKASDKAASQLSGFDTQKNLQPYIHFYIPPRFISDYSYYVVIMTRNNELPFEEITIGEFFSQAEKQLPFWQKAENRSEDLMAKAQKNLARLKEKYKNKWNDVAELRYPYGQIGFYDFVNAIEGNTDLFEHDSQRTTIPIWKINKKTLDLCKTDQPQWLVIRWDGGMPNREYSMHKHTSILNNFNFEYVYNFFFDPEKVKGQAYKPLRSPTYKEAVVIAEASDASKKNASDKNVFFFEDFSTTTVSKKPIGWDAKLNGSGSTGIVTKPDGLEGNWVELRGHYINATLLKKPLPQNFTLSYDLVVPQNFTWGAKGLTMQLSKETSPGNAESFLIVRLRPGSDGNNGEVTVETKFPSPPGYSNGTKWYVANGFSNNKKNNRITVTIKKADEKLQVFVDKTKIAEYEKAIPAAHLFNALSFDCNGNSDENDKYFISNIKITKD